MKTKISPAMRAMLSSVKHYGIPTMHLRGLAEHGGAHHTLEALKRRGLVTYDHDLDRWVLTESGKEARS